MKLNIKTKDKNGITVLDEPDDRAVFFVPVCDAFHNDKQTVPQSPNDEIPAGSVPDACC